MRARESNHARAGRKKVVRARAHPADAVADPFRHVVVLMLENRSFDHVLGDLARNWPAGELDGVPAAPPWRTNVDSLNRAYEQRPPATRKVDPDPNHELEHVMTQLAGGNAGFIRDYEGPPTRASTAQLAEVMAVHPFGGLRAMHELADRFAVCDAWYSSVPGPTWPNRLYAMSGTSQGRVKMPTGIFHPNVHKYDQPSVFRRIREAKRVPRIYFGDFPLALLLSDQRRASAAAHNFAPLARFRKEAAGKEADFPDFAFLEPDYMWPGANDDHPSHDVMRGQQLIADVYNAIRANAPLWESTLLVIVYDEHGGFYDHVPPGDAIPPDDRTDEYTFDRRGVRVPAVLVSPWIERQVLHTELDHTSVLRFLQLRWGLGDLGRRTQSAHPISEGLRLAAAPRSDTPERIVLPASISVRAVSRKRAEAPDLTQHQLAILAFSSYLDSQTKGHVKQRLMAHARKHAGPAAANEVATERARLFLKSRGAKV